MLWWATLIIAFGPSVEVTSNGGQVVRRPISVASGLVCAPLVGIPWAGVGLLVGSVSSRFRGCWIPVAATLGTVGGGTYSLVTSPFDGWLVLTMPISCFLGT